MTATRVCFTPRQLAEFVQCDPKLQAILVWVTGQWPPADLELTSIHRTNEENQAAGAETEIHVAGPPFRAIDLRATQEAAEAIAARVNARWEYDPTRPTMVVAYAKPHGTGPHCHLQVHPRTTLRQQSA